MDVQQRTREEVTEYFPATHPGSNETERPLTGCCSTLSSQACHRDDNNGVSTACFDCNEGYTCTTPHSTIPREEVLRCMSEYQGLCLSDEQFEGFLHNRNTTNSLLKVMTGTAALN